MSIYGIVISEAAYDLKMLWQMPYLVDGEYFEIISASGLENLSTEMTYTNTESGYYSRIEAAGDGMFTFYDDGYIKTDFTGDTAQRIVLTRNGSHNDLDTLICEGSADGVKIYQSAYGLHSVGVKTAGTFNIALSDGLNTANTGDIEIVEGYPVTLSTSVLNDIIIQSGKGDYIQMVAGSAGHAVSFYTLGKLDIVPQTNILASEKAVEPNTGGKVEGWYTESTFENEWDFDTVVSENIVLYAKFAELLKNSGDVNDDSVVDRADLALMRQYFAGWSVNINEDAADVDHSGVLDRSDLARFRQYFAGWAVTFE